MKADKKKRRNQQSVREILFMLIQIPTKLIAADFWTIDAYICFLERERTERRMWFLYLGQKTAGLLLAHLRHRIDLAAAGLLCPKTCREPVVPRLWRQPTYISMNNNIFLSYLHSQFGYFCVTSAVWRCCAANILVIVRLVILFGISWICFVVRWFYVGNIISCQIARNIVNR